MLCAAVAAAVGLPAVHAGAATPSPPDDIYAHGYVGLCDARGHNVDHGSVYDKPFVVRAVSSVAAPQEYQVRGHKATLYAYTPRSGADASNWSGDELTATSDYTNVKAPMAQAVRRDFALSDYLNEFPPMQAGYVELRLYFSAPNLSVDTATYPAAMIQVTGTSWRLVKGGRVNCNAGSATTPEQSLPASNKSGLQPPQRLNTYAQRAVSAANTTGSASTGASSSNSAGTTAAQQPATPSSFLGGPGRMPLVVSLLVVGLLAGAGAWAWRRRRAPATAPPARQHRVR
jgi:hypothetical protein